MRCRGAPGNSIFSDWGVPKIPFLGQIKLPPTITEMKCRNCGQPPSKELPLYTIKGHGFCVACLLLAVKVLDEKLEKDVKITKYLEKREN